MSRENPEVCSAHAEMIPDPGMGLMNNGCLLRTRGDDPGTAARRHSKPTSAPHTRR